MGFGVNIINGLSFGFEKVDGQGIFIIDFAIFRLAIIWGDALDEYCE